MTQRESMAERVTRARARSLAKNEWPRARVERERERRDTERA